MSYNYRYHQQGVGHLKRQQQLKQQQLRYKNRYTQNGLGYHGSAGFNWLGGLFASVFWFLMKMIKWAFQFAAGLIIGLILLKMMNPNVPF